MRFKRKFSLYILTTITASVAGGTYWPEKVNERLPHPTTALEAIAKTGSVDEEYPVWGLDLSHHQPRIAWDDLKTEKPYFLIFKATEGTTHEDKRFGKNWSDCKQHDIIRGAYHFFSYSSGGAAQARHFIQNVRLSRGDLPPVLDIEFKRRMPKDKWIVREIKAWIRTIEAHYKVKPIIYVNESYYNRYVRGKIKGYPLWICDYKKEPQLDWTFWQVTDSHMVEGIDGYVDKNVFVGDPQDLADLTIN